MTVKQFKTTIRVSRDLELYKADCITFNHSDWYICDEENEIHCFSTELAATQFFLKLVISLYVPVEVPTSS